MIAKVLLYFQIQIPHLKALKLLLWDLLGYFQN